MPIGVKTIAEPLSNELVRREVLPVAQAVDIVWQLAHQIAQRHESGRLHMRIDAGTVSYESDARRAELHDSPNTSRSFGGADCDDEFCAPELQRAQPVSISVDIAAAREALQAAGLANVDPRRIDLYQLGTLLCRMLTGHSVNDFLSRPRVAAKVPPDVREVIERALGHDAQRAFRSATELRCALEALDASKDEARLNALAGSTRKDAKPDTTPSLVAVGKADTDVGRAAPSPTSETSLPFHKLGHYEIVGRLGRGGMGDVYKGYEPRLDRFVAIKVLPAEFSRHEDMVQRFYAEASAAAKLVHPNTVEIHFIGQDEVSAAEGLAPSTLHFFAMRFVDGESLADLLARRTRLNVDEALAIIEQALAGLAAAHRLGMVHRDIKPGNILIDRERQRVLLADFGLVKSLQAAASLTASGVIVGTVDYMAPEQGRGATVDARADLYAIGVVLYQMLSGRLPFKADSATGMIFQHVYETARPLHEIAPDVPRSLSDIVAKLMAKSPDARYQSVEALLSDLRAFHQGQPLPSGAVSVAGQLERPRTVIIPTPRFADEVVLPATLTQVAAPNRWQRMKQGIHDFFFRPSEEVIQQIQTTENQVDGAISEYEQRHTLLRQAVSEAESVLKELDEQRDIWQQAVVATERRAETAANDEIARAALNEKHRAERMLADLAEQRQSQQSQLDEMRHKLSQVTGTLERLRSQRDVLNARLKVARAQIHLAGGELQGVRSVSWVSIIRWKNVAQLLIVSAVILVATKVLFELGSWTSTPSYAPVNVEVRSVENFNSVNAPEELYQNLPKAFGLPFSGCDKTITALAVSPTGNHVAAATGGPVVFIWDADTGKLLHRLTDKLREVNAIAFNSDGTILATGESERAIESTVKFWSVDTGESLGSLPGKDAVQAFAFSPKSPLFATVSWSKTDRVVLWDHVSRTQIGSVPSASAGNRIAFSPDGSLLAASAARSEMIVWDVGERKVVKSWFASAHSTSGPLGPLFLPDNSTVLTNDRLGGSLTRWNARTGERLSQTGGGVPSNTHALAISNDGRWLAGSSGPPEKSVGKWITLLDARSGVARGVFPGHQTLALAFSPKGDRLFSGGGYPFLIRWDTNVPVLVGNGPEQRVDAGPLLAMARDKPLCLMNVSSQIGIWNYETQSPLFPLRMAPSPKTNQLRAALSSDARRAALMDNEGRVGVWDAISAERIHESRIVDAANHLQPQISFSADAELLWIATSTRLWRLDLKQSTAEPWQDWPSETVAVSLSPDGRIAVASTKQRQFHLWETATRQRIFQPTEYSHRFHNFAFSSSGRGLIGLEEDGELFHWNLERRTLFNRFRLIPGRSQLSSHDERLPPRLAFMPDERFALAFRYPLLRVIDLENQKDILQLISKESAGDSPNVHITHNGRFAVTGDFQREGLDFWNLFLHENLGSNSTGAP